MKKKLLLIMIISLCISLTLTACAFFDSGSNDVDDNDNVQSPNEEPSVEYTVTLVTNGGTLSYSLPSKTNSKNSYDLPSASKTGYAFKGWYNNSEYAGEALTSIPAGNTADLTLYACFRKLYTVTYEANGGEHINKSQYVEGDTVALSPAYKSGIYSAAGIFTRLSAAIKSKFCPILRMTLRCMRISALLTL